MRWRGATGLPKTIDMPKLSRTLRMTNLRVPDRQPNDREPYGRSPCLKVQARHTPGLREEVPDDECAPSPALARLGGPRNLPATTEIRVALGEGVVAGGTLMLV